MAEIMGDRGLRLPLKRFGRHKSFRKAPSGRARTSTFAKATVAGPFRTGNVAVDPFAP